MGLSRIRFRMRWLQVAVALIAIVITCNDRQWQYSLYSPRWRITCQVGPAGDEHNIWYEFDMRWPQASRDWQTVTRTLSPECGLSDRASASLLGKCTSPNRDQILQATRG